MQTNYTIILGLGKTGLSCIRYLTKQNIPLIAIDTRSSISELAEIKKAYPELPIYLGEVDEQLILQAKEIIISPGLSLEMPAIIKARAAGIPILGDIELFARAMQAPVIGITGTNAKGTVTTLVGEMLKAADKKVLVGGNIGTPALDLLTEPVPEYYVLELSSFQLETTYSLQLIAATILNVSEDHLDRHNTMANYVAAKQRIYQHCQAAIYNRDDKATQPSINISQKISFGLTKPQANEFGLLIINKEYWLAFANQPLLNTKELRIQGRHNWSNALAALAIGHALHLPIAAMLQALRTFKGLPHRCEWVIEKNNITWCDDSKGTNVGSTLAAINGIGSTIAGKIILIAGGLGKGADFTPLRAAVNQYVREVILFGQDAALIANALQNTIAITHVKNLPEAVLYARQIAQSGDTVLLSPACASWDMFRNYEERGELFKELVRKLH